MAAKPQGQSDRHIKFRETNRVVDMNNQNDFDTLLGIFGALAIVTDVDRALISTVFYAVGLWSGRSWSDSQ